MSLIYKGRAIVLGFAIVGAALLLIPAVTEAAPPVGEYIYFQSDHSGGPVHIWRIHPDGTGLEQVTSGTDNELAPEVSKDGLKLLFNRRVPGTASNGDCESIWVKDLDTGNEYLITGANDYPNSSYTSLRGSWHPDGEEIVLTRANPEGGCAGIVPGTAQLWVVDVSDLTNPGVPQQLLQSVVDRHGVSFCPDGETILHHRKVGGVNPWAIYSLDRFTGVETPIIAWAGGEFHPACSPDQNTPKVAWDGYHTSSAVSGIFAAALIPPFPKSTGDQTAVTATDYTMAAWSPDMSKLAVTRRPGRDLCTIYIDGSNLNCFFQTGTYNADAWWAAAPTVPNTPPILDPIGDKTIGEGELLQFTISAFDADGDTLALIATNLPTGASFTQQTNTAGLFSWIPDYTQEGNYPDIEFTVTDDGSPMELDVELITITVGNVNRAPEFEIISPQTVDEGSTVTFTVNAIDPDGNSVSYSASPLPPGASFNSGTREFSWTPSTTQAGNYVVTFYGTDNGSPILTGQIDVAITVGDVPTPVEQADNLVDAVLDQNFPTNIENSYLANLKKVRKFIEEGKIEAAIGQLEAFINKVEEDVAEGQIDPQVGAALIEAAQNLINELS